MRTPKASSPVPKWEMSPSPDGSRIKVPISLEMPVSSSSAQNDRSLDALTADMKSLMKKIQDLSHLGIEDKKIHLPKICVVGDQSTGKSSLIEAISEIQVPRNEGTCTRCPLEINLSQSDGSWRCVVYLCYRYAHDPPSLKGPKRGPKKKNPMGEWIAMDGLDNVRFAELTDRAEVTKAIWCAQLAILNPNSNCADFNYQNPDLSRGLQVKFSPNAVRLDISGPSYPNLSFYDLPGVISQAEQDDESFLVDLVENLVKSYVEQENSIVLLTLPMTDDATNSSAARLVRGIVGAKERTLGVLTKPDRWPVQHSLGEWEQILKGEKFRLGHGYYVVRNNSDPGVSHDQARSEEAEFFASGPWQKNLNALEGRFGVKNLVTALSDLLKRQIIGSLPEIANKIDGKLKKIDEELNELPDLPTEDVQRTIWGKVTDLERRIHEVFDETTPPSFQARDPGNQSLQEQWNSLVQDFKIVLQKTRPILDLSGLKDRDDPSERIDADCEMLIIENKSSPPKKRKANADPQQVTVEPRAASPKQSPYKTSYFENFNKPAHCNLDVLEKLKNKSHTVGVPNQLDPRAIETLYKKMVEHWKILIEAFIQAAHGTVQDALTLAFENELSQYHQTRLYQELNKILSTYMQSVRINHLAVARDQCHSECEVPFTMAQEYHRTIMGQSLSELRALRAFSRASAYLRVRGHDMSDERTKEKIRKIAGNIQAGTNTALGEDKYSDEIEMMANARAYYEIASSRFLDTLCQSTTMKLFKTCRIGLIEAIQDELRIFGENGRARCLELMAEDPKRQQRRAFLQKEREKLVIAQNELNSLHSIDTVMAESDDSSLTVR
ncbi:Dynamin [Penicillium brevicompactum]|uniref:Dynamin n=1 Tax=Penicillium brevicompactum TaxID=5074 RepID=UPI002541A04F|nr:Dynamin [Penicillium brevicompactum]KAJ5347247.1 Dynamin [Penicillium brevicompactum]